MTVKNLTKEQVKGLLGTLGRQLFDIENYYLIYSELGLHYNKSVNEKTAIAYLEVINLNKGFFVPVQKALRSVLTVELNSFILSKDVESLQSAIYHLKLLEGAPDLTAKYEALKAKNNKIMKHIADLRNKYYAHKTGQDLSGLNSASDKDFQELFGDIKELFNQAGSYFGQSYLYMDGDSRDSIRDTHDMMNNLLRGENQRLSEIEVGHLSDIYLISREKWLKS